MPSLRLGLATVLLISACAHAQQTPSASNSAAPSLIVLVTIDQLRADYLDRFGPQFHGGLARLTRGGAWFTNAHQDHAITETAPGHASLLAGRFPRSTGIATNFAGVGDSASPLLEAPGLLGASPHRFRGTTLIDWLVASNNRSRALSVSMKDRGAILPIGRSKQSVFWYGLDGRFTTSRYYADTLPAWIQRFNSRRMPQSIAGQSWTLMLGDSAYRERDSVSIEGGGRDFVFPHIMPADSAAAASAVRVTPWMDYITIALALEGLQALNLGKGPHTDVLAVSLSATDLIGHTYGPDSREIHDQILRVDRMLGVFLDSLYRLRDSSNIAVILTGDHGVGIVPEIAARTVKPVPQRVELQSVLRPFRDSLAAKGLGNSISLDVQALLVDRPAFAKAGVNADSVVKLFADAARRTPGVARVDHLQALMSDTLTDPVARRWAHQFPAGTPIELVITLTPFSLWGSFLVASHGSPYDYDTHVPLIFYGPRFRPGRYGDFARTVDIAPTLAELARTAPLERLDGVVLRKALR